MALSTKALAERNASLPVSPYLGIPDIVLLGGGLPIITKDGQHIGSIGISGATQQLDEEAGLDAIAGDLG